MEDMKQHLSTEIATALATAAVYDAAALHYQKKVAESRARAGQRRAFAQECERILAAYDAPAQGDDSPAPAEEFEPEGLQGEWRGPVWTTVDRAAMRATYSGLSAAERGKYGSFARYLAAQLELSCTNSEGVDGRKVVHTEAHEEQGDAGLPESVWVPSDEVTDIQVAMSSDCRWDERGNMNSYLLQESVLTPEQKAKYGVTI